jgi:putative AdoMet-dependent methyltransferase
MLAKAQTKMPDAQLIQFDFTKGLPPEINYEKFDFIISTYALHHLTDDEKIPFILSALKHLNKNGRLIIGDVSFRTKNDLEYCQSAAGDEWDDEEYYFVFTEIEEKLKNKCLSVYHQISHCAGIMEVSPIRTVYA